MASVPVEHRSSRQPPVSTEELFQQMLLRLAASAAEADPVTLVAGFCREAVTFFGLTAACFWRLSGDALFALCGAGSFPEGFAGKRVRLEDADLAAQAVLERETVFVNGVTAGSFPLSASLHARSALALPVRASGEVLGALLLLHSGDPHFFTAEIAARAGIAAAHLGLLYSTLRMGQAARESRRRADVLVRCSQLLQSSLEPDRVWPEALEHIRGVFRARLAALCALESGQPRLRFVAAGPELASQIDQAAGSAWLSRVLTAACANERAATLALPRDPDAFGQSLAAGECLCAPIVSDGLREMLVVFSAAEEPSTPQDRALLGALAEVALSARNNLRLFSRIAHSNRNWAEIFDALTDYLVVHDDRCNVLRVNRSLAAFAGVRPADLIQVNMRALVSLVGEPGPRPCLFCNDSAPGAEHTLRFLDREYLVTSARLPASENESAQTIHILKDITDRREAERRYRELFDNIQEGLFFAVPGGRFVEVNDAMVRMLGYSSREELLQVDIAGQLYAGAGDRERFEQAMREHGAVRGWQETLRKKDGTPLHTLQNVFAVRDAEGNIVQYRGLILDITDLKQSQAELLRERDEAAELQAKLMHTEKLVAVGQLVSGVAHEVNNPLTAILGFSDLLLHDPNLPERAKKDLRVIMQEAQRTKTIVQNLLSFARQVPPRREPVYLNHIIRSTIELRSYDLSNSDIEVVENLAPDLPPILGDSHQLQQVCMNILNNAYDAVRDSGRRGRLEITTRKQDDAVEISISDNGCGIKHPERIFDPFFTTKEIGKGTGLGLSICYGIVRSHGGEISARNNSPGEGATFTVRLPLGAANTGGEA